jgi:glucose-6-phosphate 1-dehydrogenase
MVGNDVSLDLDERPHDEMEPYERLLGDALKGDPALFAREDTVEAAWHVVDGILDNATPIHFYEPGTWGPSEADHLLPRGRSWLPPRVGENAS